jgi:hypothetical protein
MGIIQAILAGLLRSAGKILNTVFGWATTMLFGHISEKKKLLLSAIAFGSILWIFSVIGIFFPNLALLLVAFAVQSYSDSMKDLVRVIMLGTAMVLPAVIGAVGHYAEDSSEHSHNKQELTRAMLRGYPYTLGLSFALLMMTIIAPIMKIRNLVRGQTSTHIAVVVPNDKYKNVVEEIRQALHVGGIDVTVAPAHWMVSLPTRVLTFFAKNQRQKYVANELVTLKGKELEFVPHPSDLMITGKEHDVARAHAVITEQLTFTDAYLTWGKEGNELEDRLKAVWRDMRRTAPDADWENLAQRLKSIEDELRSTKLPYEEWEILYREKLQVERGMLEVFCGRADHPIEAKDGEAAESAAELIVQRQRNSESNNRSPLRLQDFAAPLASALVLVMAVIGWHRRRYVKNLLEIPGS